MEEELRRVASLVLQAPLTRRTRRELLYCGVGGLAGVAGFWITLVLLALGLTVSASVLGTVVGLLLITVTLRLSRRFGSLHRRLSNRLLGQQSRPRSGSSRASASSAASTGGCGTGRPGGQSGTAWSSSRSHSCSSTRSCSSSAGLSTCVIRWSGCCSATTREALPLRWRRSQPLPFGGSIKVYSFPGTYLAAMLGAVCVVAGAWVVRGINAGDRALVRSLLGPSTMAERVSELERTRTLAVEDSAAALRRVERDLHDGAQMRLAALAMNLGMAREKLDEDDATVRELIDAAHRNAVDALADLRDLARGIHPPVLDNGLGSALDSLAASSAIPASVTASIGPRPAPAIETIAYFCAAELIANATKHSYANQITVNISTERAGVLRLDVSDDGIGGADVTRGSGLSGLVQRVSTVDGRIDVSSPPGGPTVVTVVLPMKA